MKTYKNLWNTYISDENIRLACKNAAKGSKHGSLLRITENPDIEKIRQIAIRFRPLAHTPKIINDGITQKKRAIIVPNCYEQIIHHMQINILKPIFMRGMYEHSYASIPGRGAHRAKRMIEQWIKNGKDIKYCMKLDIHKFFPSIPNKLLKERLTRIIKDERFLNALYTTIDTCEGLPIGFYTSQWFSNWYLQPLDHYIKENLHASHYVRYMDDMVIFGNNKKKLRTMLDAIRDYLKTMGLELKGNYQIFRFHYIRNGEHGRPLDYMGFKFYRNRTTLRKSILKRARRSAITISKKEKPTLYDCRKILSYMGWIDATDTYGYYMRHIKPLVNIQYIKRRISRAGRRANAESRIQERNGLSA